jgi:hypothetical protein
MKFMDWLSGTLRHTSYICAKYLGVELESGERYGCLFNFGYRSLVSVLSNPSRIRGVDGILIETIAKVVPRQSLPNSSDEALIIIGQMV